MKFSSYMLAVTYFIASLGLFALTLIEPIEGYFIGMNCAAVLLSLVFNIKDKRPLPTGFWNALALVLLVIFAVKYLSGKEDLIVAAARFLTVLLPLKLFDLKSRRDHIIVYGSVFFLILTAAASTVSPLFFIILALYIAASIFAMTVFNIHKELFRQSLTVNEVPPGLFDATFLATILIVSTFSIITTFVLFFTIPRIGVGFFELKTLNTVKVSGFSESVALGSMGPVKKDHTVVMRVEIPESDAHLYSGTRYFRGTALDVYDGSSWSRSASIESHLPRVSRTVFSIAGEAGFHDNGLVEQKILLEPLATDVIFALPGALYVKGRFTDLRSDHAGALYLPSPPYSRIEYTVWSDPGGRQTRSVARLGEKATHGPGPEHLQAPYGKGTPEEKRIRGLVRRLTKGLATDRERAMAIERHLMTNHAYTLDPKRRQDTTPLDDFLFYSKEGYCEHFATAMVILLREAGIPARLVTGFVQGEWNGFGKYYIVRQSDAHSWVEAYLDGTGWTTLDPTPPVGIMPLDSPSPVLLLLDMLRLKWNRYIINFSFSDQSGAAVAVESRTRGLLKTLKADILRTIQTRRPSFDSLTFSVAAVLLVFLLLALRKIRMNRTKKGVTLPSFYRDMLRVLSKMGFKREVFETPLEFARRVDIPEVVDVTMAFCKERYGGRKLKNEDVELVKRSLVGLKGRRRGH